MASCRLVTDANEDRLYLDGVLVAAKPRYAPIYNGSGTAYIGASLRSGSFPGIQGFVGILDSIRLSNVARYSGLNFTPSGGDLPNDANTVLLYNFNDATTNLTVFDESSSHRAGTLGAGFSGATAPKLVESLEGLPTTPARDIVFDPRATYLRINGDWAFNSIPIPLTSLDIAPGDPVFLQRIGDYNHSGDVKTTPENPSKPSIGVFSSSPELGPRADLNRVTGAIKAGTDYVTPNTGTGNLATDIPEDFEIPQTGVVVNVPTNAHYLFITSVITGEYDDNIDWDGNWGIHISKLSPNLRNSDGTLVLNWDIGQLQAKTNLAEPWVDVPRVIPPLIITPGKPAEFFRLRAP